MRKYYTQIHAKDATTGELKIFDGPYIEAPNQYLAQERCNNNGLGYVRVTPHWVIEEIDAKTGEVEIFEHNN